MSAAPTRSLRLQRTPWRRRLANDVMLGLCYAATAFTLAVLACVLGYVLYKGLHDVNWAFFTQLPAPVGEPGGGFLNALVGSTVMVGLASAMSVPIGVFAGIYLAEFGRGTLARAVRLLNDTMSATPSIVAGLFAYALVVVRARQFSAFAGSVALAVLMIPTITRTTEEMVRLVPRSLREAGLALGISEWRTIVGLVLRSAFPGILTGVMLAVARVSGETAALLFTAFNNRFLSTAIDQPMSSVPVQVYTYSIAPYESWHRQAWAGALVLVTLVAFFSAAVRVATRDKHREAA
jgi:phosphate transport system permease protein